MNATINLSALDRAQAEMKRRPLEVRYDLEHSSAVRFRIAEGCDCFWTLTRRWVARKLGISPFSVAATELEHNIDEQAWRLFQKGQRTEDGGILGVLS
jgi:hypothetical protein